MLEMQRNRRFAVLIWLAITGLFGLSFIGIELYEFSHMLHEGAGPQRSAFLSSFFTLVGTHGLHVSFGIVWLVVLMVQVSRRGLAPDMRRRLACLSLFWHFLDVRSEEHTSELQSLMRISYAVFCLTKNK